MSCSYADGLSEYHDKGKLGLPETFEGANEVESKVSLLTSWMTSAKHVVVYTGAGISTAAGIPDFRGPKGVWTLEKKGEKPTMNVSWDDAKPTLTHMALAKLVKEDKVKFIITQNIDGLHLRSGVGRTSIAELHGNMFVDQCDMCRKMFVRDSPAPTVGQKYVGSDCQATKSNGRNCRGKLKDFVLDWEAALPDEDLDMSDTHSMQADLSIVLGSTLQIIPAGNMPTYGKKYNSEARLVICNLQPTKQDKKADLCIHTYVDDVMKMLMDRLGLEIPQYDPLLDPVRQVRDTVFPNGTFIDWTQDSEKATALKKAGDKLHDQYLARRKEERKRKNIQKEEEAVVVSKKMQKREAEPDSLLVTEVKEEDFNKDKDDISLTKRLDMLNGRTQVSDIKPKLEQIDTSISETGNTIVTKNDDINILHNDVVKPFKAHKENIGNFHNGTNKVTNEVNHLRELIEPPMEKRSYSDIYQTKVDLKENNSSHHENLNNGESANNPIPDSHQTDLDTTHTKVNAVEELAECDDALKHPQQSYYSF